MDNFKNKFPLGTLIYADYRFYSHTTYQPQEWSRSTIRVSATTRITPSISRAHT